MKPPSVKECISRLERLPQRAFLEPDVMSRWVRQTMLIDPARISWHIARAGGVGGSESGTLVAWKYGGFATRSTAQRLAKGKLLLLPPDRANDDTSRGAVLEDHVRDVFEARLAREGRDWSRREDLKAQIESGNHPKWPWLRASVDGVYEIDGSIYIVDFKAPTERSLTEYARHLDFDDYKVQLNHYEMVARGNGVRVDGLLLAMYDYRRVARVGVEVFDVAIDRELQEKILEATSSFWNDYVMQGRCPFEARETVFDASAVPADIHELARHAVAAKLVLDQSKKTYEALQDRIARWVARNGGLAGGMLPLGSIGDGVDGLLEVRAKPVFDTERAIARLRELGVPDAKIEATRVQQYDQKALISSYESMLEAVNNLLVADDNPDPQSLRAAIESLRILAKKPAKKEIGDYSQVFLENILDACGEDPYSFVTERISSGLPRGKNRVLEMRRQAVAAEFGSVLKDLAHVEPLPDMSTDLREPAEQESLMVGCRTGPS